VNKKETPQKIAERIFKAKEVYHKERAKLPIDEKVKILIELQKIGIAANPKMKDKRVWKI